MCHLYGGQRAYFICETMRVRVGYIEKAEFGRCNYEVYDCHCYYKGEFSDYLDAKKRLSEHKFLCPGDISTMIEVEEEDYRGT